MPSTFRSVLLAAALGIGFAFAGAAANATGPLAAGAPVPQPFAAHDQTGSMQNLETLAPNKGVVLLFTRSLHW